MALATIQSTSTKVEIFLQNYNSGNDRVFQPVVCEGVQWSTSRKGTPGRLTFKVLRDNVLDFTEGNPVTMKVNGRDVFLGYVFTKSRNKDQTISVTAYDQLRYLKNKDVMHYKNLKASEVLEALAKDFRLKLGEIADTEYVIPKRNESNSTLFDIIQNALDLTLENSKKMYVLFDDFGKLSLRNTEDMLVDIWIDAETAEAYTYESSIDKNTYNRIKLYFDNKQTGKREVYMTEDSGNQALWGILQYCESINEKQTKNAAAKAEALIALYNRKSRRLTIKNAFGDIRVRAGSGVWVSLNLGDIVINQRLLVEDADHTFNDNLHLMTLNLKGGLIDG